MSSGLLKLRIAARDPERRTFDLAVCVCVCACVCLCVRVCG